MTNKLIEAFHISRRMFFLKSYNILWLAPAGDPRSHQQWFRTIRGYNWTWMARYVRGFVDSRGVFLYISTIDSEFDTTSKVLEAAPFILYGFHILERLGGPKIPSGLPVYAGMIEGPPGTLWDPKVKLELVTGSVTTPPIPSVGISDVAYDVIVE